MTRGSNQPLLISRKGIERNCCVLQRQRRPRSEKISHFSGSRANGQRHSQAPCLWTCLRFCFKERVRMEQQETPDPLSDGKLRELTSKWFIETQVRLIVQNGFFPTWFRGFISRKEAEEILEEKELGCFLIRLSDKAIGYVLSYKGGDRCRHFVISQSESGQFVVSGDTGGHDTVSDLIKYYKTSPIEPFGECLTSSGFEALNEQLYDKIQAQPEEKPVAPVRMVKNKKKQTTSAAELPRARSPKSNRTLEEVPPLPRRRRQLESDQDRVFYAQLQKKPPRELPRAQNICQDNFPGDNVRNVDRYATKDEHTRRCCPPSGFHSVYSELLDCKSKSLPLLDRSSNGEQNYRLSTSPITRPRRSPKPISQAASCGPESTNSRPPSSYSLDLLTHNAVYHMAGRPRSTHTTSTEFRSRPSEEVPTEAFVGCLHHDNTYEFIPDQEVTAEHKSNSNTYEPLEDIRPKHSFWGLKNDKWKWLFPEVKKKW